MVEREPPSRRAREVEARRERPTDELVEDAAEGFWLRFRDVVLVNRKLEEFVF